MEVVRTIKHPAVVAARQSAGEAAGRRPGAFLIEGQKLVSQALDAGAGIEALFFLDPIEQAEAALLRTAQRSRIGCYLVTRGVFFRILGLGYETSVRVLGTVVAPPCSLAQAIDAASQTAPLLVGESIQDPRNVGVLIRTADAFGLGAAIFSGASADPYSRQSVRSSTGSIFRVRVCSGDDSVSALHALRESGRRIVGASAGASVPCWEADLLVPCAIVLGNETSGLSDQSRELCDTLLQIPMYGGAHSYNVTVAAGILLYEAARQRDLAQGLAACAILSGSKR